MAQPSFFKASLAKTNRTPTKQHRVNSNLYKDSTAPDCTPRQQHHQQQIVTLSLSFSSETTILPQYVQMSIWLQVLHMKTLQQCDGSLPSSRFGSTGNRQIPSQHLTLVSRKKASVTRWAALLMNSNRTCSIHWGYYGVFVLWCICSNSRH